jgi:hypothetical protein
LFNQPPDGVAASSNPLSIDQEGTHGVFDLNVEGDRSLFAGAAPGWVGLDQVNLQVPETAREGCAVPLRVAAQQWDSQPVAISIHRGGGICVDPPTVGYGQITWERTVATGTGVDGETDMLTAEFPASPGMQAPSETSFRETCSYGMIDLFGSSQPIPGYRSLDAGGVTIQGPGLSAVQAVPQVVGGPMIVSRSVPLEPILVNGQTLFRAVLPAGAIQPGSFNVIAAGGNDVSSFQSTVQIGSGINMTSSFPPGTRLSVFDQLLVTWTGGDPDSWVTMKVVKHYGTFDEYDRCWARASTGSTRLIGLQNGWLPPGGTAEIILGVSPDPSNLPPLTVPGLALGRQHTWKYTYRFGGLSLQ